MTERQRDIRLNITQEDINAGDRWQPALCPIARALTRRFPEGCVIVLEETAEVNGNSYDLSSKAQEFFYRFYNGLSVGPQTFQLAAWY